MLLKCSFWKGLEFDQKAQTSRIVLLRNSNVKEEELGHQEGLVKEKMQSTNGKQKKYTSQIVAFSNPYMVSSDFLHI